MTIRRISFVRAALQFQQVAEKMAFVGFSGLTRREQERFIKSQQRMSEQ